MKKRWKGTALMLSIALMTCACANTTEEKETVSQESSEVEENTTEEKEYQGKLDEIVPSAYNNAEGLALEPGTYISIVGKGSDNNFWKEVIKGVEQAEKDINEALGYSGNDKVKVTFSSPEETDNVDEQVSILDEELARYPIALGISIADVQACEVQFDIALENNIPVVAFDSGSSYQGIQAMISTDNEATGVLAASQMAVMLEEEGQVIMFVHESDSEAAIARKKAFRKEIKSKYEDMSIVKIVNWDELDELKEEIISEVRAGSYELEMGELVADNISKEDIVDYILTKYPHVKGCYATNSATTQLFVEGLERKEMHNVSVIGYDAGEDQLQALIDGKIDGLIVQNPFGMGYAAVIACARAGLSIGNEAFVNTGYTWVTKDNMNSDNVQKMLY